MKSDANNRFYCLLFACYASNEDEISTTQSPSHDDSESQNMNQEYEAENEHVEAIDGTQQDDYDSDGNGTVLKMKKMSSLDSRVLKMKKK